MDDNGAEEACETNPLFKGKLLIPHLVFIAIGPMHLLKPSEDDRLVLTLDKDALAALKAISGPVVLVSIVGKSSYCLLQFPH